MFYYEQAILKVIHFQKILFLSKEKITFLMKKYELIIEGNDLSISSYYDEETCIKGNIERIIISR